MKICIDAGHGGKDPGAVGSRSSREKDFTLDIAKRCAAYVIKLGHSTVLTRSTDIFLELTERANIANKANVDIFVSIHCNSAENSQANGIETFNYTNSVKGKEYASKVQNALIKATGLNNRGVKENTFTVLKRTASPGVLVEVGFISNLQEELLLMSEEYRDKVAKAIAEAITGQILKIESETKKPKFPLPLKMKNDAVAFKIENDKPNAVKGFLKDQLITAADESNEFYKLIINGVDAWIEKKATTNR